MPPTYERDLFWEHVPKSNSFISKSNKVSLGTQLTQSAIYLCFYTCFQTSWAWNKDTVLPYSIQYCTVQYTKAQPLVGGARTWQCTPDTWTNLHDWTCERMFTSLKVHNLKVRMLGTYCSCLSVFFCNSLNFFKMITLNYLSRKT